jgi:hypothetical protein
MAERTWSAFRSEPREAAPPEGTAALAELALVERRSTDSVGESWVARAPDGTAVALWRAGGPEQPSEERSRRRDALSRLTQVRHPRLVPVLEVAERDQAVCVVSELDRGRSLRRVLAIATLTPAQAAIVAAGVLDGLHALHEAGLGHGRLHAGTVWVGHTGEVRLADWGLGPPAGGHDATPRGDHDAALRLFGSLRRSVRRPGPRRPAEAGALLQALDACGGPGEAADLLAGVRRRAGALLGEGTGEQAAHELALMVAALERDAEPPPAVAPPIVPQAGVAPSPAAIWRPARRPVRGVAVVLVLLVVAAIAGAAAVAGRQALSRGHAAAARPRPAPSGRTATPTATPAPSPSPSPSGARPLPALAPAVAGSITAVELQPLQGSCQPTQVCPVQVIVRLQPQPSAEDVRWSFRVFDRCTGATSTLPGAGVTALAGWPYVYGTSWPRLPEGRAVALVAVTEAPAAAASPAVLAGDGGSC